MVAFASQSGARHRWCLVSRTALLLATVLLPGCFDVPQREIGEGPPSGTEIVWPTRQTIDDFEDGDSYPRWNAFGRWETYAWPEPQTIVTGKAEPGSDGNDYGRFLGFELTEPGNGNTLSTGAVLTAYCALKAVDLTSYDKLAFEAKLEPAKGDEFPVFVNVRATVGCRDIGKVQREWQEEGLSLFYGVRPASTWETFDADLKEFVQGKWQTWERVDPETCLRNADSIEFQIWPDLDVPPCDPPCVTSVAGRLTLDDVYLERFETDAFPSTESLRFSPWACESWSEDEQQGGNVPACGTNAGRGERAPAVTFSSAPQELTNYPGVALCAQAEGGPSDLTAFRTFSFEAKLDSDGAFVEGATFWLQLRCSGAPHEDSQYSPLVQGQFEPSGAWSTFELSLAELERAETAGFDRQACLAAVDEICFTTSLGADAAQAGTLSVDALMLK